MAWLGWKLLFGSHFRVPLPVLSPPALGSCGLELGPAQQQLLLELGAVE